MKKTLLIIGVFCAFAGAALAQVPVMKQLWYKVPVAKGPGSSYLGFGNTERGMAYNPVTDHVLLVARKTSPQIIILNAANGDSVGKLDVTPVSGGTFPLNLVDVTDDGVIYACNLSTASNTTNFTVYRWENETAVPTIAFSDKITHAGTTTLRYGDAFAVTGTDNKTKIFASGGGGPANEWVAILASADGLIFTWSDTVKVGSGNARLGVDSDETTGNIWGNQFHTRPGLYKISGDTVGTISRAVAGDSSYGIKFFKAKNKSYVIVANQIANKRPKIGRLIDVTGGPSKAFVAGVTPTLKDTTNLNGTSAFAYDSKRNAIIVMITNNGIGSYELPAALPVELAAFTATARENSVQLAWRTATETNNYGFEVQRSADKIDFAKIGFVNGKGTTTAPQAYAFNDANLKPGTYYYRLKQVDFDGTTSFSSIQSAIIGAPSSYALEQNYPNPFNPTATIRYQLVAAGEVSLEIFNTLGQKMLTLVNGKQEAGVHTATINAQTLPSGLYFYRLTVNGFSAMKKMVVSK